jgi:hypothetical protein
MEEIFGLDWEKAGGKSIIPYVLKEAKTVGPWGLVQFFDSFQEEFNFGPSHVQLLRSETTLGRRTANIIQVRHERISGSHCAILHDKKTGKVEFKDLSTYGCYKGDKNSETLEKIGKGNKIELLHGDSVTILTSKAGERFGLRIFIAGHDMGDVVGMEELKEDPKWAASMVKNAQAQSPAALCVKTGDEVLVNAPHGVGWTRAMVRFRGQPEFIRDEKLKSLEYVGLDMPSPVYCHDGAINGKRYFSAQQSSGAFVACSSVFAYTAWGAFLKTGFLEKRGGKSNTKGWKKRWFRLERHVVRYFEKEGASLQDAKGTIDLRGARVAVLPKTPQGGKFGFQLIPQADTERMFVLAAEDEKSRDEWVRWFAMCCLDIEEGESFKGKSKLMIKGEAGAKAAPGPVLSFEELLKQAQNEVAELDVKWEKINETATTPRDGSFSKPGDEQKQEDVGAGTVEMHLQEGDDS